MLQIHTHDNDPPLPEDVIATHAYISKYLNEARLLPIDSATETAELAEPQLALLGSIQSAAAGQIAASNEFFRNLTKQFDERHQAMEKAFDDKRRELEESIYSKRARLDEYEARIKERENELDDRDNTHVRRAIRHELIGTIQKRQENFVISPDTTRLRWPIHAVFLILLTGTFAGAAWSAWSITTLAVSTSAKPENWTPVSITLLVKSIVFAAGFLTSAGLYISWMNRWFDKHAEAQFHTKQFEIDFNRASWAVEAALEWKASQKEQMPDSLLVGITKNLFDSQSTDHASYAPLDALASSLLGSASNLKLNVGGSELSFDRKGIRDMGKREEIL